MTKYEWETELKKNIHRLPPEEIGRVMEYYGELFEDYVERGKSETEIIGEFGNPIDVADKILAEYDAENPPVAKAATISKTPNDSATPPVAPIVDKKYDEPKNAQSEFDFGLPAESDTHDTKTAPRKASSVTVVGRGINPERLLLFVLFNVITCGALFIAFGIVWLALVMLVAIGAGAQLGGLYTAVISFGLMSTGNFGAGLAHLGIGVAAVGFGIFLTLGSVKLIKLFASLSKKIFVGVLAWLSAEKERV